MLDRNATTLDIMVNTFEKLHINIQDVKVNINH